MREAIFKYGYGLIEDIIFCGDLSYYSVSYLRDGSLSYIEGVWVLYFPIEGEKKYCVDDFVEDFAIGVFLSILSGNFSENLRLYAYFID